MSFWENNDTDFMQRIECIALLKLLFITQKNNNENLLSSFINWFSKFYQLF